MELPWEEFHELGMEALSFSCVGRMEKEEGASYNAVCSVNGLEEYLLLSGDKEWMERVLHYLEK